MDLLGDDGLLDLRRKGGRRTDPDAFVEEARRHRTELPEANAELAAWARERPGGEAAEPAPDHCHRCTRPPRLRCNSCAKPTCAAHSWVMLGVCRDCATEERMKRWHGSSVSDRNWLEDR